MRLVFSILVLLFLSSGCKIRQFSQLLDGSEDLPQDLKAQVDFLSGVRFFIPQLFTEATTYSVDMFDLLDQQKELLADLEKMATYQQNISRKETLLAIDLDVVAGEKATVQRSINPVAISSWKVGLLKQLTSFKDDQPIEEQIIERLSSVRTGGQYFSGLLSSLLKMTSLTDAQKAAAYKRSDEEKMAIIDINLLDADSFDFKRYPWIQPQTVAGLKLALASSYESSRELTSLLELHMLLQDTGNTIDDRLDTAIERISAIGEADLDIFVDERTYKKRLAALVSRSSIKIKTAVDLMGKHIKSLSDATVTTEGPVCRYKATRS